MPSYAELLCQRCGSVEVIPPPKPPLVAVKSCQCGGKRQVVRVRYDAQARSGDLPFPFALVPSL